MKFRVAQAIWYDGHKKTIKRLLKNINGVTIIEWESKHNIGVVMPSIWKEWKDDIDSEASRADALCVCEPKPRNRYGGRRRYSPTR